MGKVTYLVVNGMILQEDRDGVVREYRPDTNGNTIALTDATGVTDSWEYWPFGEVRTRTGSNPTPFQFGGILGYYTDSSSRIHVRARHYRPPTARWQTVDPYWPGQPPYIYVHGNPEIATDPSGRVPNFTVSGNCDGFPMVSQALKSLTDAFRKCMADWRCEKALRDCWYEYTGNYGTGCEGILFGYTERGGKGFPVDIDCPCGWLTCWRAEGRQSWWIGRCKIGICPNNFPKGGADNLYQYQWVLLHEITHCCGSSDKDMDGTGQADLISICELGVLQRYRYL